MNKLFAVSALSLALAACHAPAPRDAAEPTVSSAARAAETARINAWFDQKYEEQLLRSPLQLAFVGRKERNDEIDDFSEARQLAELEWLKQSVVEMESSFDYARLDAQAKLSYDLWKYNYAQAEAGYKFRHFGYIFDQMNGPQAFLPTFLISFHTVDNEADLVAYIARIKAVEPAMQQLLDLAKTNVAKGHRPPRFAFEGVRTQAQKVIEGAPFTPGADSALWADVQSEIGKLLDAKQITAARADELRALARNALNDNLFPAYQKLIAWTETEIPLAELNPTGVGAQPEGLSYYQNQLQFSTTTDMSIDEVHQLGLAEVARLRGELSALKDRVGFDGSLKAFYDSFASAPENRYPNTDEGRQAYIDDATAAINNLKKVLPDYFGVLPKADLVVKRVEPFREQAGAAQHYFPGTPDGSRPGVYYAHLLDMNAMPKTELEVIAYHEGIPGHHMQISVAQESTGVPKFRTQAFFGAYTEGWALYTEALAAEMPGTYTQTYAQFGRLMSEQWRAIRLVVDTGLHAKGWTEQEAVNYFAANSSTPLTSIRSEVQRYLVNPGQATSYKVGMIKIQQLRRHAEAELGDKFDIRQFHDVILTGGALPLTLLERQVNSWIAEVKAAG